MFHTMSSTATFDCCWTDTADQEELSSLTRTHKRSELGYFQVYTLILRHVYEQHSGIWVLFSGASESFEGKKGAGGYSFSIFSAALLLLCKPVVDVFNPYSSKQ